MYVIKYVRVTNHYDAKDKDENMALQQLMGFLQRLANNGLNFPDITVANISPFNATRSSSLTREVTDLTYCKK